MNGLHNLPKSIDKKKKRVGRGMSSGKGKMAGQGRDGQKSRDKVRIGFEGGQMRLTQRLRTVRGLHNLGAHSYIQGVNLGKLEQFYNDSETVTLENLIEKGLVRKSADGVKILGAGKLTKKLKFAPKIKFSTSAQEALK
jgi:large subunit ribosomal protein L15